MQSPQTLPPGPFPSTLVLPLVGISSSTLGTWSARGYCNEFDYQGGGRGRARQFSLLDALSLALMWEFSSRGLQIVELPLESLRHWAVRWLESWDQPDRVTSLIVRFCGLAGSRESLTSMRTNTDDKQVPPPADIRLTMTFNLDGIFLPIIDGLVEAGGMRDRPGRVEVSGDLKKVTV